jgi:hypothetical protein
MQGVPFQFTANCFAEAGGQNLVTGIFSPIEIIEAHRSDCRLAVR